MEGHRLQIVGDDFLVSNANLIREAANLGAANTVLLKPNQQGTLSETLQAWNVAKEMGYPAIVSARSGETEDTTIVELPLVGMSDNSKSDCSQEVNARSSGIMRCALKNNWMRKPLLLTVAYSKKRNDLQWLATLPPL